MTISSLSAARLACEIRNWELTNLELQKILYIAHMAHFGSLGKPLIEEPFEAWDFGPVVANLYHHVKGFGSNRIRNVFHSVNLPDQNSTEYKYISGAVNATKSISAGQLVEFTHRPNGAWIRSYVPGKRGQIISTASILDEYNEWKR
jgi:uncharacterized phage-associated protein